MNKAIKSSTQIRNRATTRHRPEREGARQDEEENGEGGDWKRRSSEGEKGHDRGAIGIGNGEKSPRYNPPIAAVPNDGF